MLRELMVVKIVCSVIGLLLGIPCGAVAGYFIDCALFGTGAHMEICGIAGIVYGAGPGALAGGIGGCSSALPFAGGTQGPALASWGSDSDTSFCTPIRTIAADGREPS